MKRRDFLRTGAVAASTAWYAVGEAEAGARKLRPPADGRIRVAFLVTDGAQVIDVFGPWEVFQDVMLGGEGRMVHPFDLFTVAEQSSPLRLTGGVEVVPRHTFETAPQPHVLVIPALRPSPALLDWVRRVNEKTDVTLSVCTGSFVLARAGLLNGKEATTHHDFFDRFSRNFPAVRLKRGVRMVENDHISTAGGLTSGIDLALRVVERYYGRDVARRTAEYMEYESTGWILQNPG